MMLKGCEQKVVTIKQKNKINVDSDKHCEKACGESNNNNPCRPIVLNGPRAFSQRLTKKKSPHDEQQQALLYQLKKIWICVEGDLQNLSLQKAVGLQQTDIDIEIGHWQEVKMVLENLLASKQQQANAMQSLPGGCDE